MRKMDAIRHFGGWPETAVAIGCSEASIRQWPEHLNRKQQAQVITESLLAFGLKRTRRAFPDFFLLP